MADILIKNGFVLTMQGEGVGVIEDGAVAIEGSRIVAVGKTHELEKGVYGARARHSEAVSHSRARESRVHTCRRRLRARVKEDF